MLALSLSNSFVTGDFYLITDFRTRHIIPNTAVPNVGGVEPIILQAASINKLYKEALSTIFASDTIYYELVDSTTSGGDRGRIYYRQDASYNSTGYDWRVVLFRRWETFVGSGIYTSLTDPLGGGAFLDFYTFNNSPVALGCSNN